MDGQSLDSIRSQFRPKRPEVKQIEIRCQEEPLEVPGMSSSSLRSIDIGPTSALAAWRLFMNSDGTVFQHETGDARTFGRIDM
ncbi:hypothetical protein FRC14_005558 [Serendipita sp. 396]|nr:hypothetical protein FRC14_005558 [Serendipita sp. 396]